MARKNISDFHEQSLPKPWTGTNSHGAAYGERYYPIQRVGLYVPGGSVPWCLRFYDCITAQVAKVPQIVIVTLLTRMVMSRRNYLEPFNFAELKKFIK